MLTTLSPAHTMTVAFADMPRVEPWLDEITPWHVAASGNHTRALIGTSGPVCLEVEDSHKPEATEIERTVSLSIVVPDFRPRSLFALEDLGVIASALKGVSITRLYEAIRDVPSRRRNFDVGLDAARALHAGLGEALAAVDSLAGGAS